MRRFLCLGLAAALLISTAGAVSAQGVQTGTIRGTVLDAQGLPVPGATVTVSGPSVQGTREAVTDLTGSYTIPALPPGSYDVKFELSGFNTVTQQTTVALGLTVDQNVTLRPGGIAETVQVVAATPLKAQTPPP